MEKGDDASCQRERQRYYYPLKLPSTGYKPGDVCVDASPEKIDVIEHIERHHMAHSQRRDKSYFVSNDKGFIYNQLVVYLATYDKEPITEQDFSNGPIRAKRLI